VDGSPLEQPVGEWVLRTALKQGACWAREGRDVSISVNISADHLLHGSFVSHLQTMLAEHPDMPPARLELEVLETAALADMEQAIAILLRCRELGVQFALDDFGTGYSSLTYLRQLPVDLLKIDQSFIRDILSDPDDRGIVEGIIRLAGACHRSVIGEGVETLEHGLRCCSWAASWPRAMVLRVPCRPNSCSTGWINGAASSPGPGCRNGRRRFDLILGPA
jgi:EAL domain-containing protein (putative c-di-GMP-specific phosphodiesterase class I)